MEVCIGPATLTIEQAVDNAAKASSVNVTLGVKTGSVNPLTTFERLRAFLHKD